MIVKVGSGLLVVGSLWQNNHLTSNGQEDNHACTKGDFHQVRFQLQFCNRCGLSGLVSSSSTRLSCGTWQGSTLSISARQSGCPHSPGWRGGRVVGWLLRQNCGRLCWIMPRLSFQKFGQRRGMCGVVYVGWEECLCAVCQVNALDGGGIHVGRVLCVGV